MGRTLAQRGIDLVYGGARIGLMGVVADSALSAGGRVIGVMPQALIDREIQHTGLTELHTVETMHARKLRMADLSDGFVALPGGAGTLEEIFEQWTWAQLGIHQKPCGFLNTDGYYDPMRAMIDRMATEGFLRNDHASMLVFESDAGAMVDAFLGYAAPPAKFSGARGVSRVVAALVQDRESRVLLVRKRGTRAFMQPGGKRNAGESHLAALERELGEELGCGFDVQGARYLGVFVAPAANEEQCVVEAELYRLELTGAIGASAEIEEIVWVDPVHPPAGLKLAPLTRDHVLPIACNGTVDAVRHPASASQ